MDTGITQLAKMMRARRAVGERPYTLLLGSSLSLTPAVRRAVCDSEDWEAFWEAVSRTSPTERRALMHEPLSQLDLQAGCDALAQLVGAGYFNVVLTLNVDDALDNALKTLPASEYRVWVHGEVSSRVIVSALDRLTPRIKVVKLRGDVNVSKLPLTPEATFEFPHDLEEAITRYLRDDTVIVGDLPFDDDVHRCIKGGDGALWVVAAEESDFLEWGKRIRKVGEVIEATEFNAFFTVLAEALGLGEAEEAAPEMAFVPPEERVNPYRGLEPFEPEHARYFFGREVLTEMLVEQLRRERFLAVLGASGSGKSSVVRAGVLPALAEGKLPGSGNWPVLVAKPGQNPQEALAGALAATVSAARSVGVVDFARLQQTRQEIQERLLREESALHELVGEVVAQGSDDRRVVVVIDQFEELFTLCPFEQRQRFIDALLYAVEQPDGHTTVLLTLRADFVAQCTAYPDLSDLISSHQVWVRAMDDAGLRAAIERPAWLAGMRYEPGLVPLILADVGREPGALPLLEDALWSLFEYCRQGDEVIELREYREIGGVQGALAKRAEDVYATLTVEEQEDTRRILLQLVEMREGQEATRRRATLDELITVAEERAPVEKVVQRLTDARLLTTTRDVETGRRVVDISHEALIRGWPRLQEWLEESREDLLTYQQLREAATEWERGERHESYLYRGARLAKVVEWRAAHEEELNELERAFLDASVEVEERAAREEEARRQRELEQAQALAEEQRRRAEAEQQRAAEQRRRAEAEQQRAAEQARRAEAERQRAEEQARAAGRLRRLAAALAVVFLLAVGAAVYAGIQQQQAKRSAETAVAAAEAEATARAEADDRRVEAVAAREKAVASEAEAVAAQATAEANERLARSGQLAAQSQSVFEEYPQRSLLLAVEALNVTMRADEPRVPAAEDALRQALANSGGRNLTGHDGPISAVATSSDNHWLITGGGDGTTRLRHLTDLEAEPLVLPGHGNAISAVAISPDNHWLATGSDGNITRLWDLTTPDPAARPLVLRGDDYPVTPIAFSPDNHWLVTASEAKDLAVRIWDLTDLQAGPIVLWGHRDGFTVPGTAHDVTISPDGRWLVFDGGGYNHQFAYLWDLATPDPPASLIVLTQESGWGIRAVAFTPDSQGLVTVGSEGSVRIWDLRATDPAAEPIVLPGSENYVSAVAFSPDVHWLAIAAPDNTIRLWQLSTPFPATEPTVLRGHTDIVNAGAFSLDNHWLVTASGDGNARLWDLTRADPATDPIVLRGHQSQISQIAFSPDHRWLATGSDDRTIHVWDLTALDPAARPRVLRGHEERITRVLFTPDSRWLVTASRDMTARLWDLSAGTPAAAPILLGHQDSISRIVFSHDEHWLVTASWDFSARLWDMTAAGPAMKPIPLRGNEENLPGIVFSSDNRWLATTSRNGGWATVCRLWDLTAQDPATDPIVLHGHESNIVAVAFRADDRQLVTVDWDTTARLWDLTRADPAAAPVVLHGKGYDDHVAFHLDTQWLAVAQSDNTTLLWDLTTADLTPRPIILPGHDADITRVAISPNGHWLATSSRDSTVRLCDLTAPDLAATSIVLRGHADAVLDAAFSPDSHWLVTEGLDETSCLWDLAAVDPSATPIALRGYMSDVFLDASFSPDNHWLSIAQGNEAHLWDLTAPNPAAEHIPLRSHEETIKSLLISLDSHWLVTASYEDTARLWNLTALDPSAAPIVLRGHEAAIYDIGISPDSRWLATGSGDGTVRLWDLTAPDPAAAPIVLPGYDSGTHSDVAFSPDSHWLVTASDDGTTRLWNLRLDELMDLACRTAGRNLTRAEWTQYFPGQEYRQTCEQWPLEKE